MYCAYNIFFVRKNKFSERNELKVINKPFEVHAFGPLVTNRIKDNFANVIYKQETEESKLVASCLSRLIEGNFLEKIVPGVTVKVLHNENTIGLFMSLDKTMFVTVATLRVSDMNEAKLVLLISHELAHYLMDHQVYRLSIGLFREKIM